MNSKTIKLLLKTARPTAFHKLPQATIPFSQQPSPQREIGMHFCTQELDYLTFKTICNENKGR